MISKEPAILIVDDNENNRYTLTERLKREGYESIDVAENGRQTLDLLRTKNFDLVLLDIMMPELDGFGVLEQMKADDTLREIPVIMISSLDEMDNVVRCINLGAEDYLPKPFNPVLLKARIGACLEKKRLRDSEKEHIKSELKIAHDIQMDMVPRDFPLFENHMGIDLYACLIPARGVGGDLYDAFSIDDESIFFTVGDVSGKGVPAALMMARTVTLIRSLARQLTDPNLILKQANNELYRNNEQCMFVTLICGVLNRHSGMIKYANAGHVFPILVDENEKSTFVESAVSSPLALMENAEYETFELRISPGNKFILYSDGVTEAFNNKHKQFGEERLLQSASQNSVKTAKLLVEKIVSDVKKHAGDIEQSDDIVVLTIRWLAVPADTQTIQVSNDSDEYPKVLAALYDFCHEHHIPNETRGNLQLILEESVINVMSYAYPKGVEGLIEVLFKANSEWFSITLVDSGKAFNPLQKDINLKVENKEWENGGMGISIFKELTDKIDYNHTDESNHLEMWVKIN